MGDPLPSKIDRQEDIPEGLQDYYHQPEGVDHWELNFQPDASHSGIAKLKTALDSERTINKQRKDEIKKLNEKLGALDLDGYEKWRQELANPKKEQKKKNDEQDIDELFRERLKPIHEEHQAAQEAWKEERDALMKDIEHLAITNKLKQKAIQAGVDEKYLDYVVYKGQQVFKLGENRKPEARDADGKLIYNKSGLEPLSMDEWFGELATRKDTSGIFKESRGSDAHGSANRVAPTGARVFDPDDQSALNNHWRDVVSGKASFAK